MTKVALNDILDLTVESAIDGRVSNRNVQRYASLEPEHLVPVEALVDGEVIGLVTETVQSHVRIAEAVRTRVLRNGADRLIERKLTREDAFVGELLTLSVQAGEPATVEKIAAIYTSRDQAISEPGQAAFLWAARAPTFEELLVRHKTAWRHIWQRCRIEIDVGERETSEILDLHIFHLLQTVSESSVGVDVGVPARGLHGEGYRGHIFWDELLIFPFLNLRFPAITRALLLYRYRRLPEARWAAREAGFAGAMYPWQSGSDGRNETPRQLFNPRSGRWIPDNSWQQQHVGIAVAYNVWLYYQVTDDLEFMSSYGAELIIEIARFFASIAKYDRARDRYEIRGVMGPGRISRWLPRPEGAGPGQ